MLDQLTSIQLSEWQVYDRLEPIGEERREFSIASLSSLVLNIARTIYGKTGRSEQEILKSLSVPGDYMPEWDKDLDEDELTPVKQTTEEQEQIWLAIASAQNKRVKKNEEREAKLNKEPPKKKK